MEHGPLAARGTTDYRHQLFWRPRARASPTPLSALGPFCWHIPAWPATFLLSRLRLRRLLQTVAASLRIHARTECTTLLFKSQRLPSEIKRLPPPALTPLLSERSYVCQRALLVAEQKTKCRRGQNTQEDHQGKR